VFRFSESQQALLQLGSEAEAVFRMVKHPKKDIFDFGNGRQITLDELPSGQILDVLVVPGSEQLSAVLEKDQDAHERKEEREKESLLTRVLSHF
jgi:hypothetical protein